MAFCKFSTENRKSDAITIDSVFFDEYLPVASGECVKVYMYGLSKCQNPNDAENTLENFANALDMCEEDVKSAFMYWQEENLVTILNLNPIEVRYLPVRYKTSDAKLFKKEKYAEFNKGIQEILNGRMITPHEYREYYLTMQSMHIEPSAMLMIAKYCTEQKGDDVGYNYILTVSKNWAYQGVHEAVDVEKKLQEMEALTSNVKLLFEALKSKKSPSFEAKQLYEKWTKQFGYDDATLIYVAKIVKRGGFEKLAENIEMYAELKLFSIDEIAEYEKNKNDLKELAVFVCKSLGLFYETLDPVINTFILKWKQMGYDAEAIKFVAGLCFKRYIRTFDGMDEIISKFYSNGIVSLSAIEEYVSQALLTDKKIKEILEKLGLSRQVTSWDRDFYRTWKDVWNFDDEIIDFVLSMAVGKSQPMTYVNKVLSNFKEKNIDTLEKAKKEGGMPTKSEVKVVNHSSFATHSFSAEELNALFDNLDEVKLV